jgi:hypothetical protein
MQITAAAVPAQETITRDNVTMRVDAVIYYRVLDPVKAIVNLQNYKFAVAQVAQTSLRAVTGRSDMDQLLSEREKVNAELKDVIDEPTEQPWGIRVERVEIKDVSLPEAMKRSMSRQAEAERERRARIKATVCRGPQLAGGGPGDGVQAQRVSTRPPARRQRTLRPPPRSPERPSSTANVPNDLAWTPGREPPKQS